MHKGIVRIVVYTMPLFYTNLVFFHTAVASAAFTSISNFAILSSTFVMPSIGHCNIQKHLDFSLSTSSITTLVLMLISRAKRTM